MNTREQKEQQIRVGNAILVVSICIGLCFLLTFMSGCSESDMIKTDKIATDANNILVTVKDVAPVVTAFLPPPVAGIANTAIQIGLLLTTAWFGYRKKVYETALVETVDGIEVFKKADDIGNKELASALNTSQTIATKKIVNKAKN